MTLDAARAVVELITGGWRAQAVYTAVKLGIPDHIAAGRTTDADLAAACGSKEDGVHRLMRLLVAVGMFEGNGRTGYHNTPLSTALLDVPGSQRDMCLLYGEEFYAAWGHAHTAISTVSSGFEAAYGTPLYAYLGEHQDASDRFQRAMKAGNLFFDHVPGVYDFAGKHVVDIGGGNGQLLAAILSATPDARGTVLDREHVVAAARANLGATIGLDRVEVVGGSMFDGVPQGGDVYLLCRVLAGHSDDDIVGLFESIRAAMSDKSARLLLLDRLVTDDGDSTMLPALWDLHLLMTTGGRHRSRDHLTTLLNRAGLTVERSAELPVETTALIVAPNA
ncbi:O-methyltransferase [Alloactinosynnema sp. L-07]|uniref:methyltransferase n=1 Tax=Alloactinosynnema sp. L-07 TaxID=1653480 RepID=UPI00065EFFE1|nr:methyltransferase [Alloactinosynnema sp. L-07]CRK58746.1 O-methyltransferase [Alloactinosynnema sp. L-07]